MPDNRQLPDGTELPIGDPEVRKVQTLNTQTTDRKSLSDRLNKFSSWSRAVSAVAHLKRYVLKDKSKSVLKDKSKSVQPDPPQTKSYPYLTTGTPTDKIPSSVSSPGPGTRSPSP
uniref:Uncharacterized protein n=1 Tax=Knipowitschia caucasica TaxID=637954 RepID=A0AAV2M0R7_KNICA